MGIIGQAVDISVSFISVGGETQHVCSFRLSLLISVLMVCLVSNSDVRQSLPELS